MSRDDENNAGARRFMPTLCENRSMDIHGEPLDQLPGWSDAVELDGIALRLFPPADLEIAFRIPQYHIFAPYARAVLDLSVADEPMRRPSWPAGSAFLAPPGVLVRGRLSPPVEFLTITVEPERAEPVFERAAAGRGWTPQVVEKHIDPGIARLHREIRRSLLSDPIVEPSYLSALCDGILARIGCRLAGLPTGTGPKETLPPGRLRVIAEQIERDLAGRVSVEALARSVGLSRSHFSRAFQAAMGETPREFIINRRIRRARDLLADTDRPLADIAAETGFSSHAHLSTTFKKRMGVTPAEYRRTFEADDD
ncbi:MAG: AraC family transcriptional regulator [Pseudomonadota bacterium]